MEKFELAEGIGKPDGGDFDAFSGLTEKESPKVKPDPLPVPIRGVPLNQPR